MTELQPTEIELTGKKKKTTSLSIKKIVFFISILIILIAAAILTAVLANRASSNPETIQSPTLPVDTTVN